MIKEHTAALGEMQDIHLSSIPLINGEYYQIANTKA